MAVQVVASVIDDWDSFFTFFPNDPNHHTPTALAASAAANVSAMPKHRFNHNYYIYQDREGLLNFIQWDTDLTFSEYGSVVELFFGCPQWRVPLCQVADGVGSVYCTKCFEYEPYNVSQVSLLFLSLLSLSLPHLCFVLTLFFACLLFFVFRAPRVREVFTPRRAISS